MTIQEGLQGGLHAGRRIRRQHIGGANRKAIALVRAVEPLQCIVLIAEDGPATQEGDTPVPSLQQVLHGLLRRTAQVGVDPHRVGLVVGPPHGDKRQALGLQGRNPCIVQAYLQQEQAIDVPLARQADQLIGLRAPRYQTEQLEVAVIEAVGDALDELREGAMPQVASGDVERNGQGDGMRPTGAQIPGRGVRWIAEFLGGSQNARTRRRMHRARAVKGLGDRGARHACASGDLGDRRHRPASMETDFHQDNGNRFPCQEGPWSPSWGDVTQTPLSL